MRPLLITLMFSAAGWVVSAGAIAAQVQRGAIYGTARDASGAVLPGVVLQLTSELSAAVETVTGARGEFRFADLDPGSYTLQVTLEGFAPFVRRGIVVGVGASVAIGIDMALAGVAAEVVVTASTPVLDVRRHGHVTNFDQAMLNGIPTARDPWALMQHVPGVSIGRPNVGGSESTNQAQFAARGDNGTNTMWNIDGVTITDMSAVGASTSYFDFNVFEETQYAVGGLDARQQTGGLAVNLVSKRGTNAWRGGARTFFSSDALQGENISSELKAQGLSGNRIRQLAEYGGDVGGPLWANRLWVWAGLSRTDVRQLAINGFPDDSIVNTAAARADAQATPATRLSFFYHRAEKLKNGRGAGIDRPPETTWDQSGPTDIYKAEASRVFGTAMFLSAKYAYVPLTFALTPRGGLDGQAYQDFAAQVWHGSFRYFTNDRTQHQVQLDGSWARGRHDVKFGLQYRRTSAVDTAGWPGDGTWTIVNVERLGLPPGVGLANLTRASVIAAATETTSAYVGDVVNAGQWTLDLGVRFDVQRARNEPSRVGANGLAPSVLPALDYPGGPYRTWRDVSPRMGATVRLTDRTIARASYARFPSQLGSSVSTFDNAAQQGTIQYRFQDRNGDRLAQSTELLGPTGTVSGVNPADPAAPYSPNVVEAGITSPIAHVLVGGVEREVMPDFSIGVNVGVGQMANTTWSPYIGLTRDNFVEYRTAGSGTIASSTPVYRLASGVTLPPGNGRMLANRDGYHQRYWNVDIVGTRRLRSGWMLRGFLTLQQKREYFGNPAVSVQDPTPRFEQFGGPASGFTDGGLAANLLAGSEFIVNASWIYSVAGLYELPWGFSGAGTLYGREGYPRGDIVTVNRPDGLGLTPVLLDRDLDAQRFPSLHLLDARVQKELALGHANAVLTLDVFNALNSGAMLRRVREATATSFGRPQELVAPRLLRLAVQLQF